MMGYTRLSILVILLVNTATGGSLISHLDGSDQEERCEDITIPMCMGIGYNQTRMPNELNHETQEEAGLEVHQFWPLVEIKCSPDLKFFLCSMYAPICLPGYKKPLPPCRGLCKRAREGCEPIMTQYGFKWPERMDCEQFPVYGASPDQLCMDENNGSSTTAKPPPRAKAPKQCRGSKNCTNPPGDGRKSSVAKGCKCQCQHPLVSLGKDPSLLNLSVLDPATCAAPCRATYFNSEEKEFTTVWITLWSSLCAASTLMTLTTFFIETERFKYPERPIVFLSACYFLVSVGYLIRVGVGHEEVACEGPVIRYSSTGANPCSLVFLLVYFFGMASSIWWVVLSFTWFLAAGLKWGNEAIASYAEYFHVAAWLIPTLQTVAVFVSGAVDGDPVAGICYVGNMNMENLRTFVLAPLFIYLLLGTTFLIAGFVSLFRIRNVIKKQGGAGAGSKADKLEKLMIRIGIFSVLYTVPASIVIACHLYENAFHNEWMLSAACTCPSAKVRPIYSVLMLKYFMALAVGITSGVWIWSGKTLDSWRRLWRRLFGRPDPTGANAVLIKNRPKGLGGPPQYVVAGAGSASLLGPAGSVASASQHHLHHHVLKQPPLSHV
ncbi:frizzled-2 [Tribolium castaneum]|uniref:Frizzled 2 n=1 Tax=Tribolium castaneum TaxID=7070 RepID=D6WG76_TRICA|nr:PREDICTED: frizzled-2 [Tribolium castaneum]XP_015833239.1 PREDICTED: frizzled-2 [Tribolium castaneum]XP_015833240.1 PREDICTED: frizzled-2 [Tribolium castaneum]XP_968118.1 PREDICTED: frizzled-2 [Tribolium castaneum]EFA01325.1 frizzled 2 [Tribolium castaneum]|eukprot:XP_008190828.1 PREDICTED: frizzled-2 [Tribolium castaneum]